MERNLERYYMKFERPPFAPTYFPTEEEFNDPIAYVAKIKPEAEHYGVVKIVPPANFRPPFVIEPSNFEFTPRVQKLNEIDALFRVRVIFINKLVNFWHLQGQQFRLPWVENKYIDLYRLRKLVEEAGGLKKANSDRKWSQIAKQLGFKNSSATSLKQNYAKWVNPYVKSMEKMDNDDEQENKTSTSLVCNSKNEKSCSVLTQSRRRSGRMMAGLKQKPLPSLDKRSLPIDSVYCNKCGGGGDEDRLLLCEACDRPLHTYCLDPPLNFVPKGEWRCPKCVKNEVKKVSFEFGFLDSNMKFNLDTFGEWANNFKQSYFKQAPCDVASEVVETEFWQNVVNIDKDVSVKYGADLITSKMGSGFPRKTDTFKGVDAKEKILYANHPWNLNNLPILRESVLSHINTDISGMMVPWVYVGMCFSTFCWHVEDHWTYSINYNHWGERKIWYGLAGNDAENFDKIVQSCVPELFECQPDLLHHMTTSMNPRYLIDKGLSIYTVHQNPGEFVITFPKAYHAGYNEGLNFAEAVNFAPSDWLCMGRLCLSNYASVRRTCVFSHEELVMQMVTVADKMSINMCLATLEELYYITTRETKFRKYLAQNGLHKSEFCNFENIPDDERSCQACRTTLYVSALVCKHNTRIVCMDHIDQLCGECQISDCSLRYRYSLEDFIPLANKLALRTNAFEEWRKEICNLDKIKQENGVKMKINSLRDLIETWKSKRYPQCNEIMTVIAAVSQFDKVAVAINKIINRKIRLRDNTRCQKADNRYEFSELERLRCELIETNVEDDILDKSIKDLYDRISRWRSKVNDTLTSFKEKYHGVSAVDVLLEMIYEGEEFNLKLSEMELLKKELSRSQWLLQSNKIINWKNCKVSNILEVKRSRRVYPFKKSESAVENNGFDSGIEANACSSSEVNLLNELQNNESDIGNDSEEEIEVNRFTIESINKLITESDKFKSESSDLVKETIELLLKMHSDGLMSELKAKEFLQTGEGVGFAIADKCWLEDLQKSDWLDSDSINLFREELQIALEINRQFSETIEVKSSRFSLKIIEGLVSQCERSFFERNGINHAKLKDLKEKLKKFVERISSMFLKSVGYYNIFEIIAGRDDLTALVEGDPLPCVLFTSTRYNDNWSQLKQFSTSQLLTNHLSAIADQQSNLLMALRFINEKRSLKETCSCGQKIVKSTAKTNFTEDTMNESIPCFLCHATFHDVCAQWEPFMERLPPGVFLCPRCMRSRRPCIEDVEAACELAPCNSLENLLVENLLNRSMNAFHNLQQSVHDISILNDLATLSAEQKQLIHESFVMALSLEIIDVEAYKIAFSSPIFAKIFPIGEQQVGVWRRMQSRMVESLPRPIIFPAPFILSAKSSSAMHLPTSQRRNNKRHNGGVITAQWATPSTLTNLETFKNNVKKTYIPDGIVQQNEEELYDNYSFAMFTGSSGKKKCRESVYQHGDKEFCAADKCLRPYSDQVRWIQCESGCMRWYHYVCVGQTVKAAKQISSYTCYRCSSLAIGQ